MSDTCAGLILPNDSIPCDTLRFEVLAPKHAADYHEACDASCFRYWSDGPEDDILAEPTLAGIERLVERHAAHERTVHFAVYEDERLVASTSFLDIRLAHRSLEIGWTWVRKDARGSHVNPSMKLAMLRTAFDLQIFPETPVSMQTGNAGPGSAIRVQLRTDARNAQSRAAILKLGSTFEGVLRNTVIMPDGHLRGTATYSILPEEWPAVRDRLEQRISSTAR